MQRFDVSVVTGDKECAGTDANVFINLIGSLGKEIGFFLFKFRPLEKYKNPIEQTGDQKLSKRVVLLYVNILGAWPLMCVCSLQPRL